MINIYTHSTYIDSKDLLVCVHPEKKTPPHTDIPKKKMIKRRTTDEEDRYDGRLIYGCNFR